jgi:putative serine protease PepD
VGDGSAADAAERRLAPPTASWQHTPPAQQQPPSPKKSGVAKKLGIGALAVALMVGSGVAGALVAKSFDDEPEPPQEASAVSVALGGPRDGKFDRIDVAAVADVVAPSVVTITADVANEFAQEGRAVGTGVITTGDGEILTNAHVVEGATAIHVRLAGESEPVPATLLAVDPGNDLALLRIAGDGYTPATFAQPESVRIGDEVVAIGFALDLDGEPSVTLGIVSALDRTIETPGGDGDGVYLDGLIQTDAAISSGNSGGPLVNAAGEVVGINTAVARGDVQTAASNIGFAISVKEVLPVVEALRAQSEGGVRENGYLGVSLTDRTDGGQGAIVDSVESGTPAAAAGVLPGDVVIEVDGSPINGMTGLVAAIRDREPGDQVEIVVVRDGDVVTLSATLAVRETG